MTTPADAALLIAGYQTESKAVKVFFVSKSLSILLDATVADFVEGSHLKLESANGDICNVDLGGCQFGYSDTREAPESARELLTEIAGMLTITLPSGEQLCILEMSSDT